MAYQAALQQHQQHLQQINQQLQQQVLQQQAQLDQLDQVQEHVLQVSSQTRQTNNGTGVVLATPIMTHILEPSIKNQGETTDLVGLLSDQENCQLFTTDKKLDVDNLDSSSVDDVVQTLETFSLDDVASAAQVESDKLQIDTNQVSLQSNAAFPTNLDDAINAITAAHSSMQVGATQTDIRNTYQDLQAQHTGLQFQYEQYLQVR